MHEDDLGSALRVHLRDGRLPCAAAFALAHEWRVVPLDLAQRAAELGIRVGWCQLGLFTGAKKGEKGWPAGPPEIPPGLREAVAADLEEGRLPCARAWRLARRFGLQRLAMGQAVDALGVRISRCQLGCFG